MNYIYSTVLFFFSFLLASTGQEEKIAVTDLLNQPVAELLNKFPNGMLELGLESECTIELFKAPEIVKVYGSEGLLSTNLFEPVRQITRLYGTQDSFIKIVSKSVCNKPKRGYSPETIVRICCSSSKEPSSSLKLPFRSDQVQNLSNILEYYSYPIWYQYSFKQQLAWKYVQPQKHLTCFASLPSFDIDEIHINRWGVSNIRMRTIKTPRHVKNLLFSVPTIDEVEKINYRLLRNTASCNVTDLIDSSTSTADILKKGKLEIQLWRSHKMIYSDYDKDQSALKSFEISCFQVKDSKWLSLYSITHPENHRRHIFFQANIDYTDFLACDNKEFALPSDIVNLLEERVEQIKEGREVDSYTPMGLISCGSVGNKFYAFEFSYSGKKAKLDRISVFSGLLPAKYSSSCVFVQRLGNDETPLPYLYSEGDISQGGRGGGRGVVGKLYTTNRAFQNKGINQQEK